MLSAEKHYGSKIANVPVINLLRSGVYTCYVDWWSCSL